MTKQQQTKWNKKSNPKKLTPADYKDFVNYIFNKAERKCQLCTFKPIDDLHHSVYGSFGADKDDRTLVGVCRACHSDIHDHGNRDKREKAKKIGKENWKGYKNETV